MKYFGVVLPILLAVFFSSSASAAPQEGFACVTNLPAGGDDFLALHEKPSADSDVIAKLPAGAALEVFGGEGDWADVELLGRGADSGWVDAKYLEPVDDPGACAGLVASPGVSGKEDEAGAIEDLLGEGLVDETIPDEDNPAPAPAHNDYACVANLPPNDTLTLRERPSAKAGVVSRLQPGTAVAITGTDGTWVSVEVMDGDSATGWVNGKYLAAIADPDDCSRGEPETAGKGDPEPPRPEPGRGEYACVDIVTVKDYLTLREKPSVGSTDLGHLPPGSPLRITGSDGNWFSVELPNGETGWVNGKYLTRVENLADCKGDETKPIVAETTDTPDDETACDEPAVLDNEGNPIFPAGATEITLAEDVDEDDGLVSDLYPSLDTTTDAFYESLPCEPSIGGTLPSGVDEPPTADELEVEAFLNAFETDNLGHLLEEIAAAPIPELPKLPAIKAGECYIDRKIVPCSSSAFLIAGQPFEGRDIIYVHGLDTEDFSGWIHEEPGARTHWQGPQDPDSVAAYLAPGGYFREAAIEYWTPHIRENLFDPDQPSSPYAGWQYTAADGAPIYVPKSNRYMIVAWSSNDTITYAQHALLSQIQMAIASNRNVVTPPTYPANVIRPFCSNGCIIIGHSTGPLITSSAMGLARAGFFGPGAKAIPDRIFAQVSFEGAMSGSRLGTLALAVALASSPVPAPVCLLVNQFLVTSICDNYSTAFLATSILRDLIPAVAQGVWGQWIEASPVRTIMVAGAHPTGKAGGALKYALPGLDDGVVSMNSACGNPAPVYPLVLAPSGATMTGLVKAFDFSTNGGRLARAVKNFISNKNLRGPFLPPLNPLFLASGCTPYVSPTGMVMPVAFDMSLTPFDARRRYRNIYSFLQATTGHSYDGGSESSSGNPWPSEGQNAAGVLRHYLDFFSVYTDNIEESMAVTDGGIYQRSADGTYLVKPVPVHQIVRGKKVTFKLFGKRRTWWIWKRTYHLPDKWEVKQTTHYVYEFVARR